ncbi:mitochondrial genome maintenance MGM101 [Xylariaceae sp. FL1651]|nr:mitochondrial genome maintenance MGM101 [Xylariaceae sp. FL1651]
MTPLRAAGRRIVIASRNQLLLPQCTARTAATVTGVKPTSVPSKARFTVSPSTTPPYSPRSPARSATAAAGASRNPIPAVSGKPLPGAPPATTQTDGDGYSDVANGDSSGTTIDWTNSFHGLGTSAFPPETIAILQTPVDPDDIEVKPDGIIYLPEIKYRRILNSAFGPGGWGLAPRDELMVQDRMVTREYALVVHGRFVAQARGEQQYFSEDGVSTAAEGCKSNALMRCCKDLGIASELWDPRFVRRFVKENAVQQWVEHVVTKKKKQIWLRKDEEVRYPYKKS